jgi:dihydroorotate dehydrogenase electron transfer subunit
VCSNRHLADGIFEMTLKCPSVARRVQPGQFVHLRMPALEAHILRRPLSVSGIDYPRGELNIIYQVVGEGSLHMSKAERGDLFDVLGPIGRGWNPPAGIKRALLVAGGVGLAPLNLLIDQLLDAGVDEVQLVIGAQNAAKLFFSNAGDVDPRLKQQAMTDDGSVGRKGFVTELARELLEAGSYDYLATCGPEPMQRIVASLAREFAVPCEVSLERRMACGIGACRSCVVATTSGAKRVCVDGPVFDAQEVIW